MPVQNILRMGNPLLYERAKEVENLDSEDLDQIVNDMLDTMKDANGVGIAAPQLGISKRIIIFGFKSNPRYPDAPPVPLTVLINPIIEILSSETENGWEGCLSVPGLRGLVPRFTKIKYSGYDFNTKQNIEREVDGFHARVVQHELDHLDGKLFPRHIKNTKNLGFEREELIGRTVKKQNSSLTDDELKKFINLMFSSISKTNLYIQFWDVIANFVTNNKVKETVSSMLGYKQDVYHRAMIIELCKLFDNDSRSLSLPQVINHITKVSKSDTLSDINKILHEQEFIDYKKHLFNSRNKWVAHNDRIVQSSRKKEYDGVISIDDIENIVNIAKELYTQINLSITGDGAYIIEENYKEANCLKRLLEISNLNK